MGPFDPLSPLTLCPAFFTFVLCEDFLAEICQRSVNALETSWISTGSAFLIIPEVSARRTWVT